MAHPYRNEARDSGKARVDSLTKGYARGGAVIDADMPMPKMSGKKASAGLAGGDGKRSNRFGRKKEAKTNVNVIVASKAPTPEPEEKSDMPAMAPPPPVPAPVPVPKPILATPPQLPPGAPIGGPSGMPMRSKGGKIKNQKG